MDNHGEAAGDQAAPDQPSGQPRGAEHPSQSPLDTDARRWQIRRPVLLASSCHSRGCRGQVGTQNGLIWARSANHHPTSCLRQIGGYVRPHHGQQSREVITLSATGQLGMAAPGQIQLTVVIRDLRRCGSGCQLTAGRNTPRDAGLMRQPRSTHGRFRTYLGRPRYWPWSPARPGWSRVAV